MSGNVVVAFPGAAGPSTAAVAPTAATPPVDPKAMEFQSRCFDAYRARCAARGLEPKYVEKCLASVVGLLSYSAKTLAGLTEGDYERWCQHLAVDRKLSRDTQRTYQKGVRQVFKLLHGRHDLQNESAQIFGQRIQLVAHSENSIAHVVEDGAGGRRPPMSHEEVGCFFDGMDQRLAVALAERPREVRALCRDKVMFFIKYVYGLRASELAALTPKDWRAAPDMPECGRFALLQVKHGKGSRGSGKRHRLVPTTHVGVVQMLEWYLKEVRPLYTALPGHEHRLFLSEQGKTLSVSSIEGRFKRHAEAAGLDTTKFSPHSLRRSMVSHEIMRTSTEFAREKAGHRSAQTTQIYAQVPLDHTRRVSAALIRAQLADIQGQKPQ